MWPDRVSNPGPLTYETGALPTALHGPAGLFSQHYSLIKLLLKERTNLPGSAMYVHE